MDLLFWDGVLRGAAGALFVLLALLFAREWKKALSARLGALLFVAGLSYLALLPMPETGGWWMVPVQIMTMAAPGLFWLFTASWFDDEFQLRPWRFAVLGTTILFGLCAHSAVFIETPRGEQIILEVTGLAQRALGVAFRLASLAFVTLAIIAALRGRRADLVETRRRARLALSIATAAVIVVALLAALPLDGWPPAMGWRLLNAGGLLAFAGAAAVTTIGWRDPALLAPPAKAPPQGPPRIDHDDSALLARLEAEMNWERLHRQEGLTITAVAARLGVPEYRLRRAINQGLGARNFNAYLNGFRLAEARQALSDPAQRRVPILTIALDAGFGSLAPFNRAFRESESCTPSEYRSRTLGAD